MAAAAGLQQSADGRRTAYSGPEATAIKGDQATATSWAKVCGEGDVGGRRIGRFLALPAKHALAFAIGTNRRLCGNEQAAAAEAGGARRSSREQMVADTPILSLKHELVKLRQISNACAQYTVHAGDMLKISPAGFSRRRKRHACPLKSYRLASLLAKIAKIPVSFSLTAPSPPLQHLCSTPPSTSLYPL